MRFGDLDALKEDFKSRLADCNKWIEKAKDKETKIRASAVKAFIGEVIMTIDNAPTVEPQKEIVPVCKVNFDKDQLQEIVDKKIAEMIEQPQGEWIDHSDEGYVECPFCGSATNCEDNKDELHYCFSCGAFLQ